MKATIVFETAEFESALQRWLAGTRKDRDAAALQQFRGVVRNLYRITPPMHMLWKDGVALSTGGFKEGQDRGRARINQDLRRAFQVPTSVRGKWLLKNRPDSRANLSWFLGQRNGRRRTTSSQRVPIAAGKLRDIQKYLFDTQGVTASGWNAIAGKLGVRGVPKWISEWGEKRGWGKFTANDTAVFFHAINRTNHADSKRIQSSITIAFNRQANVMERQLKAMAERNAAKSGVTK